MEMTFSQVSGLHIVDYVVIGVFLCICMGIGIYHGYRTKKQKTLESYFLGNRKLYMVPISMSIFVTFISAISLMGLPTETYHYGIRGIYIGVPFLVSVVIANFTIVPLLYPLQLTSIYEYLELRFKSKGVRTMGTLIGMLNTVVYLGISLFAPAVALQTVAEIPLWLSIAVIGVVGTIYTAIGGIKSVVWTDVFQFVMIIIGLVAIFVKGSLIMTDHSIIQIANMGKRLEFFNFDPDPRVRHSVWGLWFGLSFAAFGNWCSQSSLQRFSSVRSLRAAKMSLLIVGPVAIIFFSLLGFLGILLYSYYNVIKCDPVQSGFLTSSNQLMPFFVLDIFRSYPGLPGIFISYLFSGSLSTFSSGINALAANTTKDIFGGWLKRSIKVSQILFAKVFVFLYGLVVIGLGYCISFMSGNVLQVAAGYLVKSSLVSSVSYLSTFFVASGFCTLLIFIKMVAIAFSGACGGPSVGLFFLGGLVPSSNWIGAIAGSISGLAFNMWISIGSQLYGKKYLPLTGNPTSGCYIGNITSLENGIENYSYPESTTLNASFLEITTMRESYIKTDSDFLYNISYTWYGFTGFVVTFMVGVLISWATGWNRGDPVEARLIFPFCRKLFDLETKEISNEEVIELTDLVKHETVSTNPPGQPSLLHDGNSF